MNGLWKICKNEKILAYLSVIGGFIVHLCLGSIYTYGNMGPYITQYMNCSPSTGPVTTGNSLWIFGLAVFGLGASMSLGGFIEGRIGHLLTLLLGCWIMSFGVIITMVTIKVHLVLIALSYGLVAGVGAGIAYGVSLAIPSEWFPQSKGLVSGIIVGGFGLGSMIFDFVQSLLINSRPHDKKLDDVSKVPISFLYMGSMYAVIQLVGSIMITKPKVSQEESDDIEQSLADFLSEEFTPCKEIDISPYQIIFELDFWILWITYALNSVVLVLILSLHKFYGFSFDFSDQKLVLVSATGALCNGAGRIMWGYLSDKIRYKILMWTLTISMAVMLGTFNICMLFENNDRRYIFYFIWVLLLHFLLSGNFSIFPIVCMKTFGSKYFTANYGLLFTAYSFGGILTSVMTTKLLDKDLEPNSYLTPFLIGSGLSLLSCVITIFYRGRSLLYNNLNI